MGGTCSTYRRDAYNNIFVGKPERKRPLGRPKRIGEDKIVFFFQKIRRESVDWMHLAQDRGQWWGGVNTVMNLRVT
jgi:hypothetical protein